MIRKSEFIALRKEVEDSVKEAFECAKSNQKNENDFVLFLSRSHYEPDYPNPWLIDHSLNEILDSDRINFLLEYLNQIYRFDGENTQDSKFSLTIELMIYTHLWESKRNLSNFKKLADLCDSRDYDMHVGVPSTSKYEYVRDNIRNIFEKHNLKLYHIIKDSYKSQLRNAFAHSLYHFASERIILENHKPPSSPLKFITFDEWTKIFLKSALFQNFFHNQFAMEIENLDSGRAYEVTMIYNGITRQSVLKYDHDSKRFSGTLK